MSKKLKAHFPTKEEEEKILKSYKVISPQEFIDKYIKPFENNKKKKSRYDSP